MAGIYDTRVDSEVSKLNTCSIITIEASRLLAPIHHRMPVILDRDTEVQWLDRCQRDPAALARPLRPDPAEPMKAYAVSHAAGNVRDNSKELLEPYRQPHTNFPPITRAVKITGQTTTEVVPAVSKRIVFLLLYVGIVWGTELLGQEGIEKSRLVDTGIHS
ncbi:SOS response-associated peptidase family protein [Paenibacillus albidus]|uniref:SOS response-associated peptidase n=1 Tax=Paenibacillus albidus TaxID=2041023 RepID=UPI001BEAC5B4|nr:SOS response-associated peptidase family protein [Paenibacillus albidus]MBT2287951.1 SOS response-associated peptidase family protein [Paenibacillus albidus]